MSTYIQFSYKTILLHVHLGSSVNSSYNNPGYVVTSTSHKCHIDNLKCSPNMTLYIQIKVMNLTMKYIYVCISSFFDLYYFHCKQCWVGLLYNTVGDKWYNAKRILEKIHQVRMYFEEKRRYSYNPYLSTIACVWNLIKI